MQYCLLSQWYCHPNPRRKLCFRLCQLLETHLQGDGEWDSVARRADAVQEV
ncbi:hypothetical protein GBAR_LOCUS6228 [Geodia barretti]|uniref:Uncharacterized protein n=1 Tax=Geodia barretti TaxID=519541 RepID=A0AA35W6J9_GEOBA|nr:hypothetical protein GBAR_LOCUS6228 [Geodia barretti]